MVQTDKEIRFSPDPVVELLFNFSRLSKEGKKEFLEQEMALIAKKLGVASYEDKREAVIETFRSSFLAEEDKKPGRYELLFTVFLEELVKKGVISNWMPVPKSSTLDSLKIDFVVVLGEQAVGAQVSSEARSATRKRRKIEELYGERKAIPVFNFKTWKKANKSVDYFRRDLLQGLLDPENWRFDILTTAEAPDD